MCWICVTLQSHCQNTSWLSAEVSLKHFWSITGNKLTKFCNFIDSLFSRLSSIKIRFKFTAANFAWAVHIYHKEILLRYMKFSNIVQPLHEWLWQGECLQSWQKQQVSNELNTTCPTLTPSQLKTNDKTSAEKEVWCHQAYQSQLLWSASLRCVVTFLGMYTSG